MFDSNCEGQESAIAGSTLGRVCCGDSFSYSNMGKIVSGQVGDIQLHNNGKTQVIVDQSGQKVCVIDGVQPTVLNDRKMVVPTGERSVIVFESLS